MSLLSAQKLSFSWSGVPLFADVSFEINPSDRIALVGPNGSGKSTLLRLIAGELGPMEGAIATRRGLGIEYLAQAASPASSVGSLSGGERVRAALSRCLLSNADLLLLDEPTNHLDIACREWLEQRLAGHRGACIFVSHDRVFLDRVATRTLCLEHGRLTAFAGNYEFYRRERALRDRQEWERYEAARRRVAAAERAAGRRLRLSARAATAPIGVRDGKDYYGRKAAKLARTARILRERRSHAEEVEKPWQEQPIPSLEFANVPRCPDLVLHAAGLAKAFGAAPLFEDLSLHLRRGDRWAVLGPNGSGKTTLLRVLAGLSRPDRGEVHLGSRVRPGYYPQECEHLDLSRSALEICLETSAETAARTLLACLKLPAERVTRPLATLSAGERAKAALARLLLAEVNFLLLDEPTNHLEIEAVEALAGALRQFPGTMVFASHDRWCIGSLASQTIVLGGGFCSSGLEAK